MITPQVLLTLCVLVTGLLAFNQLVDQIILISHDIYNAHKYRPFRKAVDWLLIGLAVGINIFVVKYTYLLTQYIWTLP